MSEFGLVVLGAHLGVHIKKEIEQTLPKKVLLVEPVPHNVEAINNNLKDFKDIVLEQVAISDKKEKKDFFFVKRSSIPKLKKHWSSGIGSFNKSHILDHRSKRFKIEDIDIDKISIQSITLQDLIEKYSITKIDKLLIDVEGSEYEILNDIDFNSLNIKEILFEYKHFDGYKKTGQKLEETLKKLNIYGYKTSKIDEENILAIKT